MASDLFKEIVRLRERGEPAALCTIIRTRGSTPGKESMRMVVRADGSFVGSVGGGCLEADVHVGALAAIREDRPKILSFKLNEKDYPDSGLYCGGIVEVFVEPLSDPTLVLFGGGHVSAAIAPMASKAGFRVVVADNRAAFAEKSRFPEANRVVHAEWKAMAKKIAPAEHAYLVVVTRGHHDDAQVLEALHASRCRPKYLGMIGSQTKKVVLFRKLRKAGVPDSWLEKIHTPMGLPIGARTHGEIAVSVVAEMVAIRRGGMAVSGGAVSGAVAGA